MNLEKADDQILITMPLEEAADVLHTLEQHPDALSSGQPLAKALREAGVEPSAIERRTRTEYVPPADTDS
ncbi:MAG: hypothetical protein ACK4IT_02650 [Thioalkalivibrionaceae bacterium]